MIKRLLFSVTAFAMLSFGATAQEVISFEASEGYSLGPINGQNGWIGLIFNQTITDEMSTDGGYSLKIDQETEVPPQDRNVVGGRKILDDEISDDQYGFSFDINISALDESHYGFQTFSIITNEDDENLWYYVNWIVFFNNGTVSVIDENDIGDVALITVADYNWSPESWINVKIEGDNEAGTVDYYINEVLVHTASVVTDTPINEIGFGHHNDGGYAYIDNFQITRGPNSTQNFKKLGLEVYPNPSNNLINITSPEQNIESITVTDLNGRIVKSTELNNTAKAIIDISDLSDGVYMLNISANNHIATQKIIKN